METADSKLENGNWKMAPVWQSGRIRGNETSTSGLEHDFPGAIFQFLISIFHYHFTSEQWVTWFQLEE